MRKFLVCCNRIAQMTDDTLVPTKSMAVDKAGLLVSMAIQAPVWMI